MPHRVTLAAFAAHSSAEPLPLEVKLSVQCTRDSDEDAWEVERVTDLCGVVPWPGDEKQGFECIYTGDVDRASLQRYWTRWLDALVGDDDDVERALQDACDAEWERACELAAQPKDV